MRIILIIAYISIVFLFSCKEKKKEQAPVSNNSPQITNGGKLITFHQVSPNFQSLPVSKNALDGTFTAPAIVIANILKPAAYAATPIILFDNPDLTQLYSSYLQSSAHYKQNLDFLARARDMYEHQAGTGRELKEAETDLTEAATDMAEKEARFRMLGIKPEELKHPKPGNAWLMSDVPESILNNIQTGKKVSIEFSSYPGQKFTGLVSAIGEVIDNNTRTVKVRISLDNKENKVRPGMYAKANFYVSVNNTLSIPVSSVVAVQGKNYIFIKKGNSFTRQEVVTGQQLKDQILVLSGVTNNDSVAYKGTMLLKGLSFGY